MVYISKVPSHQRCSRTRSGAHQSRSQGAIPGGILARYQRSKVPPWLGVNKPPTAFLRRADDSNKNLSSSALWGARVPFQGEIVLLHIAGSEGAFQVERVCQECELDFLLLGHTMGYHGGAP